MYVTYEGEQKIKSNIKKEFKKEKIVNVEKVKNNVWKSVEKEKDKLVCRNFYGKENKAEATVRKEIARIANYGYDKKNDFVDNWNKRNSIHALVEKSYFDYKRSKNRRPLLICANITTLVLILLLAVILIFLYLIIFSHLRADVQGVAWDVGLFTLVLLAVPGGFIGLCIVLATRAVFDMIYNEINGSSYYPYYKCLSTNLSFADFEELDFDCSEFKNKIYVVCKKNKKSKREHVHDIYIQKLDTNKLSDEISMTKKDFLKTIQNDEKVENNTLILYKFVFTKEVEDQFKKIASFENKQRNVSLKNVKEIQIKDYNFSKIKQIENKERYGK